MEDGAAISQSIGALPSQRAAVLVLGRDVNVSDRQTFDELIGGDDTHWIYVRTDPGAPAPETAEVITFEFPHRSVSASATQERRPPTVERLRRSIRDRLTGATGPTLVTIYSLTPLLASAPTDDVLDLLADLRTSSPREAGTVLAHLPVDPDHHTVHDLSPSYQAVVVLRRSDHGLEHQWRFPARESRSEWVPLVHGM